MKISSGTPNLTSKFVYTWGYARNELFLDMYLAEVAVPGHEVGMYEPDFGWIIYDYRPLVSLLAILEHLEELSFYVICRFPEDLFNAVREHHPSCRLNLSTDEFFEVDMVRRLESAIFAPALPKDLFPLNLILSRNLQSLILCYPLAPEGTHPQNPQSEKCLHFVSRVPNLKHLGVFKLIDEEIHQSKVMEYLTATSKAPSAASLESLSFLQSDEGSCEAILTKMSIVLDLSNLRSLDIHLSPDAALLEKVAPSLRSLERLFVRLDPGLPQNSQLENDDSQAIAAIRAFRPLRYLHLSLIRSVSGLYNILLQHGKSLRGLAIEVSELNDGDFLAYAYPPLNSRGIRHLAQLCPGLEELRLPIKRSIGRPSECDKYRALGRFDSLRTLILDLDCGSRRYLADPEQQRCRKILQNFATDEALVTGIWKIITAHQATRKLKNLRCIPFGQPFDNIAWDYAANSLGRSFLARRLGFPTFGNFEIVEIGSQEREVRMQVLSALLDTEDYEDDDDNDDEDHEDLEEVLNDIWPGNTDWGKCWKSFPLQVDGPSASIPSSRTSLLSRAFATVRNIVHL
ncbi:hypothetical protein BDW59DRAFT_165618 [Aspergillus cavernicola]|uniref:F-box domain-containing protein n=1 Tax=Aspergillus cavernicola TaxID=176166 RepID=A0ABR4HRQ3_9EURO